jgi:hypothetical protein
LITKSKISIIAYEKIIPDENTSVIKHIASLLALNFTFSYLVANSESFHLKKSSIQNYENNVIDAYISFTALHLINSALILLYNIVKNKAKGVIKNA